MWHHVVCFLVISPGHVQIHVSSAILHHHLVTGSWSLVHCLFLLHPICSIFWSRLISYMLSVMIPVSILNVVGRQLGMLWTCSCRLLLPLLRRSWPNWFYLIPSSLEHCLYPNIAAAVLRSCCVIQRNS